MTNNKYPPLPVQRAAPGTSFDAMTAEEQDQAFRDSIPHDEHVKEAYWAVGCDTCATEQMADAAQHG